MAKFFVDLQMRWGDQDAYGHINNVSQARYFEEARVRTFFLGATREPTGLEGLVRDDRPDGLKMLVASQTINFVAALEYSEDPFEIEMWIGAVGGSSLEIHARLINPAQGGIVTTKCVTTAVIVNGSTMRPTRLSPVAREVVNRWIDDPLTIR